MTVGLRSILLLLAGIAILLGLSGQVTGSFDDDDPDNDPNFCQTVSDQANCNWICGWYQAAVNSDIVTLEVARTTCPDLQRTDWLPEEVRIKQQAERERALALYEDDDPTNDPNECFASTDPDCDWEKGWHATLANIGASILEDDSITPAEKASFQSFWDAYQKYQDQFDDDDDDDGKQPLTSIRWFCAPGETSCERPTRECGPGENPTDGGCYFYG